MTEIFGYLTTVTLFVGFVPYLRDMLRGKTKPERASWFIWAVLGLIAFFSQYAEGATWSLLLPALDSALALAIFIFAIPFGVGGFSQRDIICLIIAGIGLLLWFLTDQPLISLLITIGIDATGTFLTVLKTYEQPESETAFSWVMASLGGVFAALAVGSWNGVLLLYPLYIVIANGSVPLAAALGKARK